MPSSDSKPATIAAPAPAPPTEAMTGEPPRRALWRFVERGRKAELGPNRSILGED